MPRGKSPHNPSGPQDQKLPTPPWPLWDKVVKGIDRPESEAWQMAFRDAMELGHSSSMSWEDQVQKEEEQQRCDSSVKGSPEFGLSPPVLEEGNASDVSMVDDRPLQCDSDVVVKEEREESMDMDVPASPVAPVPLKETPMQECFEAGDPDDYCSHTSEDSTNQNPPHDLDPNEDKLLGPITDISIPGGHLDDSIALIIPPGEDDLWLLSMNLLWDKMAAKWVRMDRIGFIQTHIPSLT